jgi:hypothetical protein
MYTACHSMKFGMKNSDLNLFWKSMRLHAHKIHTYGTIKTTDSIQQAKYTDMLKYLMKILVLKFRCF